MITSKVLTVTDYIVQHKTYLSVREINVKVYALMIVTHIMWQTGTWTEVCTGNWSATMHIVDVLL